MTFDEFRRRYQEYSDGFRDPQTGSLSDSMRLKYEHTLDVVSFAETVSAAEKLPETEAFLCRVSALFHDVARFVQIRDFSTFDDAGSHFDHGSYGVRVICDEDMLAGLPHEHRLSVIAAVGLHNKMAIDFSLLSPLQATCLKMTRDADKLSILDVVLRFLSGKIKLDDESLIQLGRASTNAISPSILDAAREGRKVKYSDMKSLDDFKLTLFTWSADFNYPASAKAALDRNFYGHLAGFLPDTPEIREVLTRTTERLKCLSSKSTT